jgi:DNA-binding beta-propeller fold protein YncE
MGQIVKRETPSFYLDIGVPTVMKKSVVLSPRFFVMVFLFFSALLSVSALRADDAAPADPPAWKGPVDLLANTDGTKLFVLNKDSRELQTLDPDSMQVTTTWPLSEKPNAMCLSPDGALIYVAAGVFPGKIMALSINDGSLIREVSIGHTPLGPVASPDGKRLYFCSRFEGQIVELDAETFEELRRFDALHEPCDMVITPDGRYLYAANFLPIDPSDQANVAAEVTSVDLEDGNIKNIRLPNGSSSMHGIAISPDGRYVYTTAILARYQLPTTQLERGWMNTNGFSVIDAQKREFINTVILDDVDLGAANPWPITVSSDNKSVYIGLSGTHELCIIDIEQTLEKLLSLPKTVEEAKEAGNYSERSTILASDVPQRLAFLVRLKKRIRLPDKAPRSIVEIGGKVYLGMYYSDTVNVVDTSARRPRAKSFPIGPEPVMTAARRGELAWNDATLCYQHWQSCASCHPDARSDALNWDLLNDGMGNPKNAKGMLFSRKTPPAMWHGVRETADIAIRTGFQYILFQNPPEEVYTDIESYIDSLEPLPSPYLVDGQLSEAALRGKEVFERKELGCIHCHHGEYFTDGKLHDVGSRTEYDTRDEFATPTLRGIWRTPPYMHDGHYVKLRDVFAEGSHGDVLGDVSALSDQELDDLVEYLLSL